MINIDIDIEWDEAGATVKTNVPVACPRCGHVVTSLHLCGDRVLRKEGAEGKTRANRQGLAGPGKRGANRRA